MRRSDAAFRCGVPIRRSDPAFRSGVPIRRSGKGREQNAVSFTHRLSGHFYIADLRPLRNQELA
jgi:hypothetical protein